ncbi:MAG: type II toxin-antitoxin system prevent-host-death family antitoxin [Candidatus Moraniibacteriota bacterium]|jgi:prevent-host-death family protein|nr:MAG: type II toxin-antitoxin system prevent-host-death family antitoxin [Candidatus Moranbacteria bacterium]
MQQIAMTDFRQHLPTYLNRVAGGERFQITVRGKVVARIEPEQDQAEAALQRLIALRSQAIVGDLLQPSDNQWSGDSDHV